MTARSNTDTAARRNNAAWDAFYAMRKIILDETKSHSLQQIANRKWRSVDYTKPAPLPGIEGERVMGATAWIDLTIPPQIVADVRKALRYSDIDPDTKRLLADLTSIYNRLQNPELRDPWPVMAYLREILTSRRGNVANVVNF